MLKIREQDRDAENDSIEIMLNIIGDKICSLWDGCLQFGIPETFQLFLPLLLLASTIAVMGEVTRVTVILTH